MIFNIIFPDAQIILDLSISRKTHTLSIKKSLNNKPIELYGDGKNKRDWIFVEDHIRAIYNIINKGKTNQIYNIGAQNTYTNIFIKKILSILKDLKIKK